MTENTREGFVTKTITADFRKNGSWIQVITKDADGKERFWIMKPVDSIRALPQRSENPFV